jgi:Dolichyl-phosphate-mannose-protein mannosyltransferase
MNGRIKAAIPFVILFVVSLLVRGYALAERVSPGHGDVADYYSVARNLYEGRGFFVDYIWTFIVDPHGIPNPSNTWWMPLPSILTAIGFVLSGGASYAAAKWTMIVVASLIPFVTYLTARELLGSKLLAFASAILAAGFHLFVDQTCAPLSYGPYTVFGGGALAAILMARTRPRCFVLAGLLIGLSYLSRGDSLVLLLPLALVWVSSQRRTNNSGSDAVASHRISLAHAFGCLTAFVAVTAPWLARNLSVLGSPTPTGQAKMIWLKDYVQWYTSRPETLTPKSYFEIGFLSILDQKTGAIGEVCNYTLTFLYRSIARPVEFSLSDPSGPIWMVGLAMTPFFWIGLIVLWRRMHYAVFAYLAAVLAFYGVLFSALSDQSFRTGLFSLLPTFVCAIVAGIDVCLVPLRRLSNRVADTAVVVVALGFATANVVAIKPFLVNKANAIEAMLSPYREFGPWAKAQGIQNKTFFVLNPWEFTLETGIRSVMVPSDDPSQVLTTARRFGVTHIALEEGTVKWLRDVRPGLAMLLESGTAESLGKAPGFRVLKLKP